MSEGYRENEDPEVGEWVLEWLRRNEMLARVESLTFRSKMNLQSAGGSEFESPEDAWAHTEIEVKLK